MRDKFRMPMLLVPLRASSLERWLLLAALGLLLAALWLAALPWWLAGLLSLSVSMGVGVLLFRWRNGYAKPQVLALQWAVDGRWQVQQADGVWREALLLPADCRVWPWWVYLAFAGDEGQKYGRKFGVRIFADATDPQALRRLRARLRVELS